ncbi:MAG TPA: hypothetical protein VII13_14470 [Vicinamibacteria bacterium]|jgi:hypothetical protein
MIARTVLVLAGALAIGAPAFAGSINDRQQHQRHRLGEGVRSGELTRLEATRLARQQAAIRAEEFVYRRTGDGLSRGERVDLQRDLSRSSRRIHRQKHDGQDR